MFLENSEVSPVTMFVAVALTVRAGICPGNGRELLHENLVFPSALVETRTVSRRRESSPEASVPFGVR